MKTVLAYGDSVTWGFDAASGGRHAYEDRWPTALEAGLGGTARVIAEGLSGRTTMYDGPPELWDNKNGAALLPAIIDSHRPLDLIVFVLGGNDLGPRLGKSAAEATAGMRRLVEIAHSAPPGSEPLPIPVLVVSPYRIEPTVVLGDEAATMHLKEQIALLPAQFGELADEMGVAFFDPTPAVTADPVDGVHLDAANTRALGQALVPVVAALLERGVPAR